MKKVTIDVDNMNDADLTALIGELRYVRERKRQAAAFIKQMNDLVTAAKENGFVFVDKACGFIREPDDCELVDEKE